MFVAFYLLCCCFVTGLLIRQLALSVRDHDEEKEHLFVTNTFFLHMRGYYLHVSDLKPDCVLPDQLDSDVVVFSDFPAASLESTMLS